MGVSQYTAITVLWHVLHNIVAWHTGHGYQVKCCSHSIITFAAVYLGTNYDMCNCNDISGQSILL